MRGYFYIRCWLFLLLTCRGLIGCAQNYLNDGDFEINQAAYGPKSSCTPSSTDGCVTSETSYYSPCPGGVASVQEKMLYWTNVGTVSCISVGDGTNYQFCAPHSPDWIYTNYYSGPGAVNWTPYSGNGCIGAKVEELFQQPLGNTINTPGNYILSGWIKTNSSSYWPTDILHNGGYNINFILSNSEPSYQDVSCQPDPDFPSSDYFKLSNVSSTDYTANYLIPGTVPDWTLIELPISLAAANYNWFSVNVDGQGENSFAYFGFDQFYISDAACFCPFVRNISGQAFSDIQTGGQAQQYLNLVSGNSVQTDGSNPVNVLFTAGNAINITPGFNTEAGVTAELKIASCFSNQSSSAEFFIPNPYGICIDDGQVHFCFYTKNVVDYSLVITDDLGDKLLDTRGQINTSLFASNGYNYTCYTISEPWDDVFLYAFAGSGCNGASIISGQEEVVINDCSSIIGPRPTDSVSNQTTNNTIKIYPDPFCSTVTINSPDFSSGDEVTIIDATGRVLREFSAAGVNTRLNLEGLKGGVYFVNYNGLNCSMTQKLIKACE